MANVKHSSLTGSDLHEPKSVATASVGGSYIATGAGSGAWKSIATDGNATQTTMEPKTISSAADGDVYVADGAGSGEWVSQQQSIQVYLDPLDQTRVITTLDTDLDYTFTYTAILLNEFTYNDTTKEITYTGSKTLTARIDQMISLTKTGGAASPLVEFFIQRKPSSGSFSKIQQSRMFANFTSSETSTNSMTFLIQIDPGDILKLGIRTDGNFNITGKNIVWGLRGTPQGI